MTLRSFRDGFLEMHSKSLTSYKKWLCLLLCCLVSPSFASNGAEETAEYRDDDIADVFDYVKADPGGAMISNFFPIRNFQTIQPRCYSGTIHIHSYMSIPSFPEAVFSAEEEIRIRRETNEEGHVHPHQWQITSEPLRILNIVSTSEGSGDGWAAVRLDVNFRDKLFRLVTDASPRSGTYAISTTGPGINRVKSEQFFFAFGDHHYSYVSPETPSALVERYLGESSGPPPNVMVGEMEETADGRWRILYQRGRQLLEEGLGPGGFVIDARLRLNCTDIM